MTVLDYCQNKEKSWKDEYDLCWIRIILALATVSIKKSSQTFDFLFRVQEKVKIAKQEYTSYMVVVENMMSEIDYKYEDVGESCIPFSFEWMREFDNDLRMIQSIKVYPMSRTNLGVQVQKPENLWYNDSALPAGRIGQR